VISYPPDVLKAPTANLFARLYNLYKKSLDKQYYALYSIMQDKVFVSLRAIFARRDTKRYKAI